jgi:hypothetical protein
VTGDGYYEGTLTGQGNASTPVVAIIADNGDGIISGQDGTYYRLTVSLPGNNVTGTYFGLSDGADFPNGTLSTSGSISAVAAPNVTGTLSDQTGATEPLALTFDSGRSIRTAARTRVLLPSSIQTSMPMAKATSVRAMGSTTRSRAWRHISRRAATARTPTSNSWPMTTLPSFWWPTYSR